MLVERVQMEVREVWIWETWKAGLEKETLSRDDSEHEVMYELGSYFETQVSRHKLQQ